MTKGTLILTTNGGERKMSYSKVEDTYYLATKANSNKITQIKADDQVQISTEVGTFKADLIDMNNANYQDVQKTYLSTMPKLQQFIYKNLFGKKNDMFITIKI